jgi:hypothetical protein
MTRDFSRGSGTSAPGRGFGLFGLGPKKWKVPWGFWINPTLLAFIKKEFIQALRDKRMRMIIFVIPVVQMTLFGLALSNEIKNIRLAIYAAPNDRLAQKIGERAAGSAWFRLVPRGRS